MVLTRIWLPADGADALYYGVSGTGHTPVGLITRIGQSDAVIANLDGHPTLQKMAHCSALCNMASLHQKTVKEEKLEQQQRKKLMKQLSSEMDPELVQSVMEPAYDEPIDDSVEWV